MVTDRSRELVSGSMFRVSRVLDIASRNHLVCSLRRLLRCLPPCGNDEEVYFSALGIEPRDSYIQHDFWALLSVPEVVEDMRSALVDFPHALHSVVSSSCFSSIVSERFSGSSLIFTDGYRSEEGPGFGIYVPGEFLILTDSLSSIEALRSRKISSRTHSVVYECKEALWRLRTNQFVVWLM
jgi:hypothetical protein